MSEKTGHSVEYRDNPNPHRGVPADAPRTGVPVSPTKNATTPRHPHTGKFTKRGK